MDRYRLAEKKASNGYSLAELLIVLACVAVLLTAAVPATVKLQQEWILWGAARALEAAMHWGRMHAIASNSPLIFLTDDALQEFYWADASSGAPCTDSRRQLPRGVRIAATPRRPLRFYPHGNAVPGGTYTVAGDAGSYSVVIAPGGRIRVQKN